jgi:hypothetical protein
MAPAPIPQNDPKAAYVAQRAEIDAAIARVLDGGWYILGKETAAFEEAFAAAVGCRYGVGVGNGTDALILALRALGIGPGKTVVTVSHTAVATVAAIELVGATPLLIDIDPATYTMDPEELARVLAAPPPVIGPIAAIVPVHLYGQPADLAAIVALATGSSSSRIARNVTARGSTGSRQAVSATSPASASTRPRTSGRWGMAAWLPPRTRRLPPSCVPSANMAGAASVTSASALA